MPNLELSDWLYVGGPILIGIAALVVLKVAYKSKAFASLPDSKPGFCWLPKFALSLPVAGTDVEDDLSSRLAAFGFREVRRDANAVVFSRGSALGDISVKIAKIVVSVALPVVSPAQLNIEYGTAFGCAFDTGDLWKFCRELATKIEEAASRSDSDQGETGNPYQSPQA